MLDDVAGNIISEKDRRLLSETKNVILILLTVIDLIFILLSTLYSFNFKVEDIFADYDFLVCLLLFLDLAYDYYTSDRTLKQFLIDDKNFLSIISILPFDLLFRYFSIFRLFRFIRIIKIVRVYNVIKDLDSLFYFIQNHLLKLLLIILMIYVLISSVLLIRLDDSFTTFADALWFMIVTVSTVGYGDVIPLSPIGKSLSALTIVIGIIFVAVFTAYLSAMYNERPEKETRKKLKKYVVKITQTNQQLRAEISFLNNQITSIQHENIKLKKELSRLNDNIEKLSEKLDEDKK